MRRSIALVAFCGVVGLVGAVNADTISQAQLADGQSTVTGLLTDGSATATAYSDYGNKVAGQFSHASFFGLATVAGVQSADPLINHPEAISFDFANPVVVDQLNVAWLYGGLTFAADEAATFSVTYADGSAGNFTLQPKTFYNATYDGPGATVASQNMGLLGEWSITNPFGAGQAVSNVTLLANLSSALDSTYGFESMSVSSATALSPVAAPLPAAVWGGMALMGAMGAARMRKRGLVA